MIPQESHLCFPMVLMETPVKAPRTTEKPRRGEEQEPDDDLDQNGDPQPGRGLEERLFLPVFPYDVDEDDDGTGRDSVADQPGKKTRGRTELRLERKIVGEDDHRQPQGQRCQRGDKFSNPHTILLRRQEYTTLLLSRPRRRTPREREKGISQGSNSINKWCSCWRGFRSAYLRRPSSLRIPLNISSLSATNLPKSLLPIQEALSMYFLR